jgi:hypothetical protein
MSLSAGRHTLNAQGLQGLSVVRRCGYALRIQHKSHLQQVVLDRAVV